MGVNANSARRVRRQRPGPPHQDPRLLAVIFVGGAAGTATRALVERALRAPVGTWPWATFAINLTGAFLLGLLLETLARSGPEGRWRRSVRLSAGTGFLGSYTTYSTFAVEATTLSLPLSLGYAVSTTALGGLAAAAGYLVARRLPRAAVPGVET